MPSTKPTILAVDDEPAYLRLFERTFGREYHILTAGSAREALAKLAEHAEIEVIVTDQRMPDMTGMEMLRLSRERNPDKMRIILTGYADPSDLIAAINSSRLFCYMAKPWMADEMRRVLRRAVNVHRAGGFDAHDETTGLPNHLALERILRRELNRSEKVDSVLTVLGFAFGGVTLKREQYDEEDLSYRLSQMVRELFDRLSSDDIHILCSYRPLVLVGMVLSARAPARALEELIAQLQKDLESSTVFQNIRAAHPEFAVHVRAVNSARGSALGVAEILRTVTGQS